MCGIYPMSVFCDKDSMSSTLVRDNASPRPDEVLMNKRLFVVRSDKEEAEIEYAKDGEVAVYSLNDIPFYKHLYDQILAAEFDGGITRQEFQNVPNRASRNRHYKFFSTMLPPTLAGFGVGATVVGASTMGIGVLAGVAVFLAATGTMAAMNTVENLISSSDEVKYANAHVKRSKTVAGILIAHIDKTRRLYNQNIPVRLPGQSSKEYQDDLYAYLNLMDEFMATILEGNMIIHFACMDKLLPGDVCAAEFAKVLTSLENDNNIQARAQAWAAQNKESDYEVPYKSAVEFYKNLQKSRRAARRKRVFGRNTFIKLIRELDSTLQDSVSDFNLLVNVRTAEGMRAIETDRFGFRSVDIQSMVEESDKRKIESLAPRILLSATENDAKETRNLRDLTVALQRQRRKRRPGQRLLK